jgi:hypothetical protein
LSAFWHSYASLQSPRRTDQKLDPGTGFFTKDASGNGVFERANETGGFLLGYRYNINRWLAAEPNYGDDRDTQFYFAGTPARVQADIQQITGSAVVKLPGFARIQPYELASGGALVFDPTGNVGGTLAGATLQTKGAFVYGAGTDYALPGTSPSRPSIAATCTKHPASASQVRTLTTGRTLRNHQPASSFGFNKPRPKVWYGCSIQHPYHTVLEVWRSNAMFARV